MLQFPQLHLEVLASQYRYILKNFFWDLSKGASKKLYIKVERYYFSYQIQWVKVFLN